MGIYGHRFDNYRSDLHPEIVQEGIVDTFKSIIESIKKGIVNLIDKINGWLDKHPDSKVAQGLKSILTKLKNLLTKADKIKSKKDAEEVKNEVDKNKEEAENLMENNYKYFYASEAINDAIKKKDLIGLKAIVVGIIGSDPEFLTSEFNEAIDYIKTRSKKIFGESIELSEPYEKQDGETDSDELTEDNFKMHLIWLQDNFALKERLPKIKKLGKIIYKNKLTYGKSKFNSRK